MRIAPALFALTLCFVAAHAASEDAYVVEEVRLPKGVAPEISGVAFNSKGELIVVTRRSGILCGKPNPDPAKFEWRVFAENILHEPLGVFVDKDDSLLVAQFPELTRIKDTDGDGVADLYETVTNEYGFSGNYHETVVGPVPDGKGNWMLNVGTASYNGPTFDRVRGDYSAIGRRGRNFSAVNWRGWVMTIHPNGSLTPFASGFRANNGLCRGPDGNFWSTDNQGDYIPTSPLYHVQKGKFYGHAASLVWDKEYTKDNAQRDPLNELNVLTEKRTLPAVQFPHGTMANSPAQPIFDVSKGKFGPFSGQMLIPDEAGQRVLRMMLEKVGGEWQGACVFLIKDHGLRSGNNRVAFSPDGSMLYVGQTMRGWGSSEGLQRIVYTGKPMFEVKEIHLQRDGFKLTFTEPVKVDVAKDPKNYTLQRYHFPYSQRYGAPQTELTSIDVTNVSVSEDGLNAHVQFGNLIPERIYQLDLDKLESAAGRKMQNARVCYTANKLVK